jgi:hypothetical protein
MVRFNFLILLVFFGFISHSYGSNQTIDLVSNGSAVPIVVTHLKDRGLLKIELSCGDGKIGAAFKRVNSIPIRLAKGSSIKFHTYNGLKQYQCGTPQLPIDSFQEIEVGGVVGSGDLVGIISCINGEASTATSEGRIRLVLGKGSAEFTGSEYANFECSPSRTQ